MLTQKHFLKTQELPQLSPRKRGELLQLLENTFSPDVVIREEALDRIAIIDAHRRSPLTISILVQRLIDPDIIMRKKIVVMLAECLQKMEGGPQIPQSVGSSLRHSLREIGKREILALLELLSTQEMIDQVCYILNECSHSGEDLAQILLDRKLDVSLRIAASDVIGQVGFLEARPIMVSLEQRLSNLVSGQIPMPFAPQIALEAEQLLPAVRRAIQALE